MRRLALVLGLGVALGAVEARAQSCVAPEPGAVRTCVRISHNDARLPAQIVRQGSDGSYQRETVTYLYSDWQTHPWVAERGLYGPVWKRTTWNGSAGLAESVACSRTEWEAVDYNDYDQEHPPIIPGGKPENWWLDPSKIVYREAEIYDGCGEEEVLVVAFEAYDAAHRPLRTRTAGGLVTEYFYGTSDDPFCEGIPETETTPEIPCAHADNPHLTATRQY